MPALSALFWILNLKQNILKSVHVDFLTLPFASSEAFILGLDPKTRMDRTSLSLSPESINNSSHIYFPPETLEMSAKIFATCLRGLNNQS